MIHLNQPLHQMLKTSSKVLLILLLTFGVFGCKNTYKVKDYLQDLANITGFSNENYLEDLSSYGIIDDEDKKELNKSLKGYFLPVNVILIIMKITKIFLMKIKLLI